MGQRTILERGRLRARFGQGPRDLAAAQALRGRAFGTHGPDRDSHDAECIHLLVEDTAGDVLVACCRLMLFDSGAELHRSYSAQFYDLGALSDHPGPLAEIGRFCLRPGCADPDILRIAWGALTLLVDETGVEMLFGCSSFAGTETDRYLDTFAMLRERHLAPKRWLPRVKAPDVFRFAARLRRKPDVKRAMLRMPPLLRSYLAMGGWVSDHAVVDRHMNTLHVFTGVEIAAIPPARKRLLRAVAG
ncbi:GNAT family N-acyltransferase [Pukyongiella litopenaei]|uniref:GNAT family N-acetyltransferase n=1 Tax=Pukyongiella litopenaei TaxID=2605946 RepID=UPI001B7FF968